MPGYRQRQCNSAPHGKSNTFIRCVLTSSWKWLPRIFCCVQYSHIYFICREPRLFSSIWAGGFFVPGYHRRQCISVILIRRNRLQLKGGISSGNILNDEQYLFWLTSIGDDILNAFPVIFSCRGIFRWRCGAATYGKYFICCKPCLFSYIWASGFFVPGYHQRRCNSAPHRKSNTFIRCVLTNSSKWLPQICCCDQYSRLYFICHEPCLSFPILASFWMQDDFVKVWNIAGIKINEKKGESARFLTIMISRGTIATSMALFPAVIQIWLCLPMHWRAKQSQSLSVLKMLGKGVKRLPLIPLHSLRFQKSFIYLSGPLWLQKSARWKSDGVDFLAC